MDAMYSIQQGAHLILLATVSANKVELYLHKTLRCHDRCDILSESICVLNDFEV